MDPGRRWPLERQTPQGMEMPAFLTLANTGRKRYNAIHYEPKEMGKLSFLPLAGTIHNWRGDCWRSISTLIA